MKRIRIWPGMVFGLIGLNVSVVSLTIYFAESDASFAVEPDYDQKALAWDESARQRAGSDALGWSATIEVPAPGAGPTRTLLLHLADRTGAPIEGATVEIETFTSLRASERHRLSLVPAGPG